MKKIFIINVVYIGLLILVVAACSSSPTSVSPAIQKTPDQSTFTQTPAPPTPTPVPLVAKVNGEGIFLEDYESELKRYQSALSVSGVSKSNEDQKKIVLDDLISDVLLAQAAFKDGYIINDQILEKKISELASQSGGMEALTNWQSKNGYSPDSFKRFLKLSMAAAWQRDRIVTGVPTTTEQIHARQILVLDQTIADRIYRQLQEGASFEKLSKTYDPLTGGELGWFPRDYLTQPELENIAFTLQPGQYSQVIKTSLGFHIIEVIERDPAHVLSPEAYKNAQHKALLTWLEDQKTQSQIEYMTK